MRTLLQEQAWRENNEIRQLKCMESIAQRCTWMERTDQLIVFGLVARTIATIKWNQKYREMDREDLIRQTKIRSSTP